MRGCAAVNIAHHMLGLPSLDTSQRHVQIRPITASPGIPTVSEIMDNLSVCFPLEITIGVPLRVIGVSMPIDEINMQERFQWDPVRNTILGVCREHGGECILEFHSKVQADLVLCSVQRNTTSEVRV